MSKKHCANCYYNDQCDHGEVCDDYTPLGEPVIDEEVDDMIEANRIAFRAEWFKYEELNNMSLKDEYLEDIADIEDCFIPA